MKLTIIVALMSLISSSVALQCYQCTERDAGCIGDQQSQGSSGNSSYLKECSAAAISDEQQKQQNIQLFSGGYCAWTYAKITYEDENDEEQKVVKIKRYCGYFVPKDGDDATVPDKPKCIRVKSSGIDLRQCFCKGDGCNAVGHASQKSLAIGLLSVSVLLMIYTQFL